MKNLFDMAGKVVVVTGASSGLGADMALGFAKAGATVVLVARRKDKLNVVRDIIGVYGGHAAVVPCDVTDEEQVRTAVKEIEGQLHRIDVLINNAGISVNGGVDSLADEEWNKAFKVNVSGMFLMAKYIVPIMKRQNHGRIINISSVAAMIAGKSDVFVRHADNASKAAVLGLTRGMACSYARFGITVNAVCPGLFETEMTAETLFMSKEFLEEHNRNNPTGRPAAKGELNSTLIYLAADESGYVQGQVIVVDGGMSIA